MAPAVRALAVGTPTCSKPGSVAQVDAMRRARERRAGFGSTKFEPHRGQDFIDAANQRELMIERTLAGSMCFL
jgi:hypothetical protein